LGQLVDSADVGLLGGGQASGLGVETGDENLRVGRARLSQSAACGRQRQACRSDAKAQFPSIHRLQLLWSDIGPDPTPTPRGIERAHVNGVPGNKKAPARGPTLLWRTCRSKRGLLLDEAAELVVEARDAAAAVHQMLVAAGPGRVRRRVDVQVQRGAFLP